MSLRLLLGFVVLTLTACPKLREPDRGYELKFKKTGKVRETVERRLAQAGVKAKLYEDSERLTVRLPGSSGEGSHELVELLVTPGKLEFCSEVKTPGELCHVDAGVTLEDAGVQLDRDASGDCFLTRAGLDSSGAGPDRSTLVAVGSALTSNRVLVGSEQEGGPKRTFLAEACIAPRVLEAEPTTNKDTNMPYVSLTFDGPGASAFADLTRRSIGRKVFIVIDSEVNSAPVVMEAITGGRAMITLGGKGTLEKAKQLAQVLAGGALEGTLTLDELTAYGPPSLLKK